MDCIFYNKIEPNIFLRVDRLIYLHVKFKCSLNVGAILLFNFICSIYEQKIKNK